jgi:leucyl-tRNA synthetase
MFKLWYTGAVVGVPGHDVRDFEFAKQFGIEVVRVVVGPDGDVGPITTIDQVQEDRGKMINSDFLNGIEISEAIEKMKDFFEAKGWGKRVVNYHLRDWLVSRQRYWGAPIPMIFCEKCGWNPVSEAELPVVLPTDVDFKPTGESPIARSISFQSDVVCSVCGGKGKREVDTMDTFVDSSWYFLRFCDPGNVEKPWSTAEAAKWMPVDVYVGGAEHTVLHLLYSRFFYKVFWDLGLVDKKGGDEPFLKLRHPGTILGEDGRKMSKRWGNVVNPDEVVAKFGADTLRMYEMFMGPFDAVKPWSTSGVEGVHRFINRIERISKLTGFTEGASLDAEIERQMNKLIKKVGNDIEEMSFNTAIATMMETLNVISGLVGRDGQNWAWVWERFSLVLAPFAPHLAEELWAKLGKQFSVHVARWPSYDQRLIEGDKFVVVIQVNGKVRDRMEIQADQADDAKLIEKMAVQSPKVGPHVSGGYKSIYVPRKIINLVTE